MKKYLLLFFMGMVCCTPLHAENSVKEAKSTVSGSEAADMHAKPWAFGQSSAREDKIWKKGVDSDVIFRKKPQDKMAIIDGKIAAREKVEKNKNRKLGLSFKDESGAWKVAPDQEVLRPDEARVRDNRHVLSAFANMEPTDDFSISVGPELILRDDTRGDEAARNDQPDSVFGMGMNFKYDF